MGRLAHYLPSSVPFSQVAALRVKLFQSPNPRPSWHPVLFTVNHYQNLDGVKEADNVSTLPFLYSDTGAKVPESCVFALICNLAALFGKPLSLLTVTLQI